MTEAELWASVLRLVDRAPSLDDLRAHGLHLLAAWHWRRLGRAVPGDLAEEERESAHRTAIAPLILQEARRAYDGPLIVIKGIQVARRYPVEYLRPYRDLDLVTDDAEGAQQALIKAGFVPVGWSSDYYAGLHHLAPLVSPLAPELAIEIHRRPNWVPWGDPPLTEELRALATEPVEGVPGVVGLSPAAHALAVAAHAWVELPFRRLLDLVDVAVLSLEAEETEIERLARTWGISGVWRVTRGAIDALFAAGPTPSSLGVWARNLESVRDRTVLETHVRRLLSPFWALPLSEATRASGRALLDIVRPAPSETWTNKLARSRKALVHRSLPASRHADTLGTDAKWAPRFRRR